MNGRGSECGRLERAKLAEAPMRDRNDHPRGTDSTTVERVMMALHLRSTSCPPSQPRPPLPSVDRGIGEHVQINYPSGAPEFCGSGIRGLSEAMLSRKGKIPVPFGKA